MKCGADKGAIPAAFIGSLSRRTEVVVASDGARCGPGRPDCSSLSTARWTVFTHSLIKSLRLDPSKLAGLGDGGATSGRTPN